jgi:hypothetical protein
MAGLGHAGDGEAIVSSEAANCAAPGMRQHVFTAIAIIFGIVIPVALVVLLLVAAN